MKKMNQSTLRQMISILTLLGLVVIFSLTSKNFFTANNIFSILRNAGVTGIISLGVTLVIITGGIDLSTGSIVAICCMSIANLYHYTQLPIPVLFLAGIVVGAVCGLINSIIITKLKVPEFIATLATQGIFRGLTYITAIKVNGMITNKPMRDYRIVFLDGDIGGLYYVTIALVIVVIVGQILLKNTKFGNAIYATGANKKAAALSGIKTDRIRTMVYVITGLCCSIGALFMIGRMQTATTEFGVGLEFDVIAAVVVGGCALSGGRGDMIGSFIGALFMATLDNGIYKYQINTSTQMIIKGAIIIFVVIFDSIYRRSAEKRVEKERAETERLAMEA